MRHKESDLQIKCVRWFRYQYPQYAMLLTHPINEGNGNRISGAIHKAEGAVPGVPDLLLFMPAAIPCQHDNDKKKSLYRRCFCLGIEMKTPKGSQSQEQKNFQKMFEAAGYYYQVVRTFEDFCQLIDFYIANVAPEIRREIAASHVEIEQAAKDRAKQKFQNILKPRNK